MEHEPAESSDDHPAQSHRNVPGYNLEGRGGHNRLHVQGSIEDVYTEGAHSEEEANDKRDHVRDPEERAGEEWLGSYPSFDVDEEQEDEATDDEEDVYVWRFPLLGCVGGVGECEGEEDQTADTGNSAKPIHFDFY